MESRSRLQEDKGPPIAIKEADMPKKIRVGVIGCGKIARVSHIPKFQGLREVEVASLFDVNRAAAEGCKAELAPKAEVFDDLDAFLDSGLDAVSVCTPSVFHCDQTIAALKKGLHVLCEKPMAPDLERATKMVKAAKKAGKVLQINQSLRYNATYVAMADAVAKGKIGDLIHMRCIRAAATDPSQPGGWSPGAKWFASKDHGGGVLLDIGIHMADLFKWYGGPVSEVAGDVKSRADNMTADDSVAAVFRFANGVATGSIELYWHLPAGAGMLEIYGTKGAIRHGFAGADIEWLPPRGSKRKAAIIAPKKGVRDSFQSFVRAIQGKAPTPTPGELGRDALALCDAIRRSSDAGEFVKVKTWKA